MDEIDKLLQHVTDNCDEIVDNIKQDEPNSQQQMNSSSEEEGDEKWLQNSYNTEEQSNADERLNFETMLEHIVNQMLDEAREIDDTILEMIADGEIELYRNEDNIVMMKLTELGHKKHEEDQQNGE